MITLFQRIILHYSIPPSPPSPPPPLTGRIYMIFQSVHEYSLFLFKCAPSSFLLLYNNIHTAQKGFLCSKINIKYLKINKLLEKCFYK